MSLRKKIQQGYSTMQVIAGLAIGGLVTAGAAAVLRPAYNSVMLNAAFEEVVLLAASTKEVRSYNGDYADLVNVRWMTNNGYLPSPPYTDGTQENRYGRDFSILRSNVAGTTATINYSFDTGVLCQAALDRVENSLQGLDDVTLPVCRGGAGNRQLTLVLR